ncbi:basement membrane-specific heparan sulfate proteoglycan core protein-like isoform X5, partial [Leptotrombidium deliense]
YSRKSLIVSNELFSEKLYDKQSPEFERLSTEIIDALEDSLRKYEITGYHRFTLSSPFYDTTNPTVEVTVLIVSHGKKNEYEIDDLWNKLLATRRLGRFQLYSEQSTGKRFDPLGRSMLFEVNTVNFDTEENERRNTPSETPPSTTAIPTTTTFTRNYFNSSSHNRRNEVADRSVTQTCESHQFRCRIYHQCIDSSKVCDGRPDYIFTVPIFNRANITRTKCRSDDQMQCKDGSCIDSIRVCDAHIDCVDGSDEIGCPYGRDCKDDEFRCANGDCIQSHNRCNNERDCSDGSDELNCGMYLYCETQKLLSLLFSVNNIYFHHHLLIFSPFQIIQKTDAKEMNSNVPRMSAFRKRIDATKKSIVETLPTNKTVVCFVSLCRIFYFTLLTCRKLLFYVQLQKKRCKMFSVVFSLG